MEKIKMTLKEIKPIISNYNHILIRFKNEFNSMFTKEIYCNFLQNIEEKYLEYDVCKIETLKKDTLTITLYDRT